MAGHNDGVPISSSDVDGAVAGARAELPPHDAVTPTAGQQELRLRVLLAAFYSEQPQCLGKLGGVDRIARTYAGEGTVDLWASLCSKYALQPHMALRYLAGSLDPRSAIQWPRDQVPPSSQRVLDQVAVFDVEVSSQDASTAVVASGGDSPMAHSGETSGSAAPACTANTISCSEVLRTALDSDDVVAVGAVAFRQGCPDDALRPAIWRALLGWSRRRRGVKSTPSPRADSSHSTFGVAGEGDIDEGKRLGEEHNERRVAYDMLRERMKEDGNAESSKISRLSCSFGELRSQVEADTRNAWQGDGDGFFQRAEVLQAVVNVVLTHAWKYSLYARGSCEMAALLLFVLASMGKDVALADAEADCFWLFSQIWAELQVGGGQTRRVHELLQTYDPSLAAVLAAHNLVSFSALRLGTALCTCSGLRLLDCVRLWDSFLSDPCRFDFCDVIVAAMLVLSREDLLRNGSDNGALAEAVLKVVQSVDFGELLRIAYALCAFERRRGGLVGPSEQETIGQRSATGSNAVSSLWGRVVTASSEVRSAAPAWRSTMRSAVAGAWENVSGLVSSQLGDAEDGCTGSPTTSPMARPCRSRVHLRPGPATPKLLTNALAESLLDFLPVQLRVPGAAEWTLPYTPKHHGVSLATLFRNLADFSTTVLIVEDSQGCKFGGFATAPWETGKGFFGSGECFVFACDESGELRVYPSTGRNRFYMYADLELVAFGGGDGHYALALYSDLLRGHSSPTPTFQNPQLGSSQDFVIRDVEFWAVQEID
eukprot:TRINITY_DN27697_c0_g1_i2.p1 TRINITY_DN27697_c0_g1~~TRINITY_DN27697_c0_g1_i2.p1  ORF type:complete len:781 (+),score=127.17 TRINITY_DN27697_c0_g1_i2:41-2344(+)